jgi:Ca-activated chloride channel homolog
MKDAKSPKTTRVQGPCPDGSANSQAAFPPTPTLSLWESEDVSRPPSKASTHGSLPQPQPVHPLPKGEGWGEGEATTDPIRRGVFAILGAGVGVVILAATCILTGCMKTPMGMTPLPGPAFGGQAAWVTPGSLPSLDEEVWVIARSREATSTPSEEMPGCGSLCTEIAEKKVAVPLKHTDVNAAIQGYIATVKVTQQFQNPYDGKIEAVYIFPLPENAAVNEFVMVIGDRRIRGIIRERQEAEKIYQEAKRQGYVASLLTQERPNIFTQSVANIEPGKAIDITITYFHTLAYVDGWYEFVFPMVVGPRFNPPGSTEGVGAVARGRQGASGQRTEVGYLRPNERSGHDISLAVDISAGVPIEETACRSHQITTGSKGEGRATVTLEAADSIPNKDFVLRYRVAGERIKSNLLTQRDERGGFFTLMLYPPKDLDGLKRAPLELVFVLDCSGSMSGVPLAQAKAAVERGLRQLLPGDSFQLINFSMDARQLGSRPIEATEENVQRGLSYLRELRSEGGTMMIKGIKAALEFPHDPHRLRFVCFLTDGYIGNEAEILRAVAERIGPARIFSFGVGSSPNRYLLDRMAKLGRGAVAYLGHKDNAGQVMDAFFARISHPALTDVQIDWGGLKVEEVFPRQVPDLFVGRPVVLTGRFQGVADRPLRVMGKAGAGRVELDVPASLVEATNRGALPSVWARIKIADLSDEAIYESHAELPGQIKQLALDYSLMSAYTAFVAVDSSRRTEGKEGTTVPVPVPVPEGVKYRTTVGE